MGGAGALIILGSLSAGIKPWELLTGSRPLLVMLGALTAFRSLRLPPSLDAGGLAESLYFSGTILISFSACSLLFMVTTMTEIRCSLEKGEFFCRRLFYGLFHRFSRRSSIKSGKTGPGANTRGRLSLAIALMLGFLPRFFALWEEAELACRARGSSWGLRHMTAILPLVTERMMEMAAETAEALEARGLEL
jgi:biotin transport system permease protein